MSASLILLIGLLIGLASLTFGVIAFNSGTTTTSTSASASASESNPSLRKMKNFAKENWISIVVFIVGVIAACWGFNNTQFRPEDMGDWSWKYWLPLLIIWGMLATLVAVNSAKLGKAAGVMQNVLMWVMFALLVGLPATFWARDVLKPKIICADATTHETRSCTLNTVWSYWIKIADGPEANGSRLCIGPGVKFERKEMNGTTFWHFKAEKDDLPMRYRLFPGAEKCPAVL